MASCSRSLCSTEIESALLEESSVSSFGSEFSDHESDIDYAQEEFTRLEHEDNDEEAVTLTSADSDIQWVWRELRTLYHGRKIPFSGQSGPQKHFDSVLDSFLLFFDEDIINTIVTETNRYAEQYIESCTLKPRSRVRNWEPVTGDEIYVVLGLLMLMGIIQKPTLKSYFSRDAFLESPIFPQTMKQDQFELIMKFIHFVDNTTADSYTGPSKLFKIHNFLEKINNKFQSAYLPSENIAVDESLTLWKGRLGIKQYIPLKAAKFGIKTFELCESTSGYLWNFIVYSGAGTEVTTETDVPDKLKSSKIVIKLCEPLLNKGYTLWMDNYYNSPSLCLLLKDKGVNVAGTLRHVPPIVKDKKLKKGEIVAAESNGIMVMKWKDKKDVSFITTFHDNSMSTKQVRFKQVTKPTCITQYNHSMGGVDKKDQMIQPYLLERKRTKKWYIKLFRRLLNSDTSTTNSNSLRSWSPLCKSTTLKTNRQAFYREDTRNGEESKTPEKMCSLYNTEEKKEGHNILVS